MQAVACRLTLLSAGLIAVPILANARESYADNVHFAGEANTRVSPTARYSDGRVHFAAPRVNALPAPPDGENCDVGDTPFIC